MLFIALVTCSLLAVAGAAALVVAVTIDPAGSWPFAYLAGAALLLQGAFTLFLLAPASRRWRAFLDVVFVAGETGAGVVGSAALVSSVLYNLSPRHGDYEFAPLALASVMVAHAAAGLLWAASDSRFADSARRALRRENG